jgi:hypothetical protein
MLNAKEVAYVYCQIFIYFSIAKVDFEKKTTFSNQILNMKRYYDNI